ncbi:MAG: hypothetical protein AAFX80_24435, partial [Cyanobacteria bacterium J06639_18]
RFSPIVKILALKRYYEPYHKCFNGHDMIGILMTFNLSQEVSAGGWTVSIPDRDFSEFQPDAK